MRNLKTNLLMAVGISLFSTQAFATDNTCTHPTRCDELGYTKSAAACPNGGIKCPFDSSLYYCDATVCSLGDIHFTDGACSPNLIEGKTADGVFISNTTIISLKASVETWNDAKVFCSSLGTGWRLPRSEELISMGMPDSSTTSKIVNAINTAGFVDVSNNALSPVDIPLWSSYSPDGVSAYWLDLGSGFCELGDCEMPLPTQSQSSPNPVQCVKTVQ